MRQLLLTLAIALLVAAAGLFVWRALGGAAETFDPEARAERSSRPPDRNVRPGAASLATEVARPPFDPSRYLRGWVPGKGMPAPASDRPLGKDIPTVVGELEVLCRALGQVGATSLELKAKIQKLIELPLTPAEKAAIAEYFRTNDNPAFKFQMLVAFRYIGDEHFVSAVEDYYDVNPNQVLECLSWIITRAPAAADAMQRLYERELDPIRREEILTRAGFQGAAAAETLLVDAFDRPRSKTDRKAAVGAMARVGTQPARQRLRAVIDGDLEEAVYDDGAAAPREPEMRDLRAHAVVGMLLKSDGEDVRWLFDRCRNRKDDDAVGGYVEKFLGCVQTAELVAPVVDVLVNRGAVSDGLLSYLELRARPEDFEAIKRLEGLDAEGAHAERIRALILRLK